MSKSVRIRMYRQGLGDCFLLTFPRRKRDAHVLIDCGVLTGTPDAEARMQRVAQNIADATGGRLDALVVTHEHWDHISGFLQAEAIFETLKVEEVWLAWTENPEDDFANELRARKARALGALTTVTHELRARPGARRTADRLAALLEFQGGLEPRALVKGRKTTVKAMQWVKDRESAGARMRYFKPGDAAVLPGLDDVRAYVLGPPRDRKKLGKSDPSKRQSEVYELGGDGSVDFGFLSAVESLDGGGTADVQPFDEWFRVGEKDAAGDSFFEERYTRAEEWKRIEDDWMEAAGRLALQLDSDTNNTCLALAFELGSEGRVLLFPGDAQVGNWLSWAGQEFRTDGRTDGPSVKTRDLLARTVLYKVGHHGSHNATLREQGLELMTSEELAAMIPVSRKMARKMEWKMPFPSLLRRLKEKTRGRVLDCDLGVPKGNPGALADRRWTAFAKRTDVQKDWIDYHVPL